MKENFRMLVLSHRPSRYGVRREAQRHAALAALADCRSKAVSSLRSATALQTLARLAANDSRMSMARHSGTVVPGAVVGQASRRSRIARSFRHSLVTLGKSRRCNASRLFVAVRDRRDACPTEPPLNREPFSPSRAVGEAPTTAPEAGALPFAIASLRLGLFLTLAIAGISFPCRGSSVQPCLLPEPAFSLTCDGATKTASADWSDSRSGFAVRCQTTRYSNFNAVEWRLDLEQTGSQPGPMLEHVNVGDFVLPVAASEALILHYSEGSHESPTDFHPLTMSLRPGETRMFAPRDGRSSDGVMPYCNLARQTGGGWILAVGWTGQWKLEFARSTNGSLRVRTGQERFHAQLRPGEQVRTPAVLVMTYEGDWLTGQNKFRQLMLAHFTPRVGGHLPELPIAASGAAIGFNNFSESNQLAAVDNVIARHLPVDTWWIDAGWMKGGFPEGQGNFESDPVRFPHGLRPVADRAHSDGLKFLLWFEPERVMPGTGLRGQNPARLLSPSDLPPFARYQESWRLLNLAHPETLGWLKTNISRLIRDWDVDIYRNDCNIHPAFYWRTAEPPDRVGLTEARYITGLYAYFDFLREQHPQLLIDNCASGGRRLDFEMMRRSVVLWRSDNCWQPEADQCKTYGLSLWLPLQGLGSISTDPYVFRSGMGSCATYALNFYSSHDAFWEPLAKLIQEQRAVRDFFAGDFYPLTAYTTNHQDLIAWQFHRPDLGKGLVQVFRRPKCSDGTAQFRLRGLNPETRYLVTDLSLNRTNEFTGMELQGKGVTVSLPRTPSAAILIYTH